VTGEWRKLHNEELNDLYCSPNIFRAIQMRWAGHVARIGERGEVYMVLMGNLREIPLGRPKRRCEDNIKMDFQEGGCGCVDCIELAPDRESWWDFVNAVMNLRVP